MDHSSVMSGVMNPCVTCDKNSMLHSGGTFDGSDITRISVNDFPLSSANTTRFFVLEKNITTQTLVQFWKENSLLQRKNCFEKTNNFLLRKNFKYFPICTQFETLSHFLWEMILEFHTLLAKKTDDFSVFYVTVSTHLALTFDHCMIWYYSPYHFCAFVHSSRLNMVASVPLAFY